MPLYRWKCEDCEQFETGFARIADRDASRHHEVCGSLMKRVLAAPTVRPDITPYQSPVDGRWIDSRTQRQEDLKRSGSREWHPEIKQEAEYNRRQIQEADMKALDKKVDEIAPAILAAHDFS